MILKKFFILLIRIYQYTISPFLGNVCRFEPTCSEYAILSIKKHGFFTGAWRAFRRICRCHPGHKGGFDPP